MQRRSAATTSTSLLTSARTSSAVPNGKSLWADIGAEELGWVVGAGRSPELPLDRPAEAVKAGIELFLWQDVCNVYVLRDGDAALLVDLGDGSVLEHLGAIGVRRVEWVLLTHHHREQCQGHPKLQAWRPRIAAPEEERALLERPADFRKMKPSLGDRFTVHGASYVRPPVDPYRVELRLGSSATVELHVRNFLARPQRYRIALDVPEGISAEPALLEGTTPPGTTVRAALCLKTTLGAKPGVHIVALDTTIDGKRYGQWFDLVVGVRPDDQESPLE